ncbi:DUF3238 domain-containing protein [Sporosarcina sp. YIM B06819]|uniref:DUF3238 domain-containing protein n=1 Tax=Sporosarcina sp. YIM B06819 TaxID=3081769 RepID=UPI00298C109D|nr:DUF3238 domain-containing protein [Sporosarcina sp. YIM B06819]
MLFEIKTVVHQEDVISFTWNDVGGIYHVYKDEEHVYEGTVPEFSDGDIKHAKLFTYAIERVENGEVVDVIALQTSAFAEQKNKDNPLQSLVMTTIVAKTQIALSWEEMSEVEDYDVFRNDMYLTTVNNNCYVDRDISLDETYRYTIRSKRTLAQSEDRFNVSKSIFSTAFGLVNPASSKEKAAVEVFEMSKWIAKPRELLVPVQDRIRRPNVDRWQFRYTTFLADRWVTNPNVLAWNHYFKGDDRGFDVHGEGFRTRVHIELAYDQIGTPLTFTKAVGPTIAYNRLKQFREQATASHEGIVLKRLDHKQEESGFFITHAVGNPLTPAPKIDYEVQAVLRQDGTFDMTGYHDQAPHHEVYMIRGEGNEWLPIHQAESKGLAWMSPVIAWQYWRCSSFG